MLPSHLAFFLTFSALSRAYQTPFNAPDPSPFTTDFDEFVADTLDHWHVPGLSIAVLDGDKTFSKACSSMASAKSQLKTTGLRRRELPQRESDSLNPLLHGLDHEILHLSRYLLPHR